MKPLLLSGLFLLMPSNTWAIVPHDYPGIYIHQMGHIYFIVACLFIIWVIVRNNLHKNTGWRYILLAQIFFILWNAVAFVGHIAEFWIDPAQIIGRREGWEYLRREIVIEGREYIYYIARYDHIWLVPGMLLFYMGLKEHLKATESKTFEAAYAVLPLLPIILVELAGSLAMIVLSILSLITAIKLYMKDRDNTLWDYMLWLASSYLIFSLSRSLGRILDRILILVGYEDIWKYIEPYSGSINTFTFIVMGTVSLFFFRAYESYLRISKDNRKIEAINAVLTELNQELETMVAERTMSLMALTVADRVRNPAIVIGWTCKRLLEKEKLASELGENLKDIAGESEKLEAIVKDFETLLKSKQSRFRHEDINDIIRGVLSIIKKEAVEKGVDIKSELQEEPLKINAQKNLLRAAIFHIIRNAIEATPEGGGITVTTDGDNEKVTLAVSDTGSGIPKEDIGRIFDPFFSTKLYRFGMGLPLVKQIISEHLGNIKVESEPGKGTTFKLIFPVRWLEKKREFLPLDKG